MLDGAPTIGKLKNVIWLTPAEVFEIRLAAEIADRLRFRTFDSDKKFDEIVSQKNLLTE
jgi:hypothetical protein